MKTIITRHFFNQLKKLKKKYPNIKEDFIKIVKNLNLEKETCIGRSIYKIRIKSKDINKGKSGGLRSYVFLCIKKDFIAPLVIYSKSERPSINLNELQYHSEQVLKELVEVIK